MTTEQIIRLVYMVIMFFVGTGGIFALVRAIYKMNKESKKYEVRCKLAAEFIKAGVVDIQPENAKQLLVKILDGTLQENPKNKKVVDNIIKQGKKNIAKGK